MIVFPSHLASVLKSHIKIDYIRKWLCHCLEGDELVEPESVEESKKETMEVVSNLRHHVY